VEKDNDGISKEINNNNRISNSWVSKGEENRDMHCQRKKKFPGVTGKLNFQRHRRRHSVIQSGETERKNDATEKIGKEEVEKFLVLSKQQQKSDIDFPNAKTALARDFVPQNAWVEEHYKLKKEKKNGGTPTCRTYSEGKKKKN